MNAIIPRSIAKEMTGIEWTDFSANPWIGCTRLVANVGARSGCDICYAAEFATKRMGRTWGAGAPRVPVTGFATRIARLDRLAAATGHNFAVFAMSLGDFLDAEVPPAQRAAFIDAVEAAPHLTWLLLTHRPHLAVKFLPASWRTSPPANIWPGVTVDHPLHAYRWTQHAEFWAATGRAWISAEPLAASLDSVIFNHLACLVIGGASGTQDGRWQLDLDWVREAVARYGPDRVFFKQVGDWQGGVRVGKQRAGRTVDGLLYDATPWPRHRALIREAMQ